MVEFDRVRSNAGGGRLAKVASHAPPATDRFESEYCQGEWAKVRELMGAVKGDVDEKDEDETGEANETEEVETEERKYDIQPIIVLLDDKEVPIGACAKSSNLKEIKRAAEAARSANKVGKVRLMGATPTIPYHTIPYQPRLTSLVRHRQQG